MIGSLHSHHTKLTMKAFLFTLLASVTLSANTSLLAAENTPDLRGSTVQGLMIEIYSDLSPLLINQIHSWHIRILDSNNQSLNVEQLSVIGGMPEHDHGLPTQPQITTRLENGDYLLEGVRFHMPGKWELIITMQKDGEDDQAVIEFQL